MFNAALFLISATGITYQIGLMRIFSIAQWHHFAYMIISMAMLGFGVGGTYLTLRPSMDAAQAEARLPKHALAFTFSLPLCHAAAQWVPFESLQLGTDLAQWRHLLCLYLILLIPFFLLSNCITLCFQARPYHVGKVYFVNMSGSGLGALAVVYLLFQVPAAYLPYLLTLPAGLATFLFDRKNPQRRFHLALAAAGALASALFVGFEPIRISQFKGLAQAMRFPDAEILGERHSPMSQVTALSSSMIRETPGQLLSYPMETLGPLPKQVALFFDAGAISAVNQFDGDLHKFAFLDYATSALPFHLAKSQPKVLVIGPGGGTDVLGALYQGAEQVVAVETEPAVRDLVNDTLGTFSGQLYRHPKVSLVLAEGRGFLQSHDQRYDLIQIPALDTFSSAATGLHALSETFLTTKEAFQLYYRRLTPGGLLAVTRWLKTPPSDVVKMLATMAEAARAEGFAHPELHLLALRGWNTATLVFSPAPMNKEQLARFKQFAHDRQFDLIWYPGMKLEEANQFTLLEAPYYFQAAEAILTGDVENFYASYHAYVRPATDDQPYFNRFFKWDSFLASLDRYGRDWIPYVEWGYLILVFTLLQSLIAAIILILLPLKLRQLGMNEPKAAIILYFGGLGLAFMGLEMAFIQKFMLFLAHPVYAVAVVLTALLFFSGLGAMVADRVPEGKTTALLPKIVILLAILAVAYQALLPFAWSLLAGFTDGGKIITGILLLAPLAFLMGFPFPLALQQTMRHRPQLVPWAWGINGCASVVGASLSALTAIHAGFFVLTGCALALYAVAALCIRRI